MRLEPRKRTALDGRVWWCIYDTERKEWLIGKYKLRRDAQYVIDKRERRLQNATE